MTERQNTQQLALSDRDGIRPLKWAVLGAVSVDDFVSDELGHRLATLADTEGCFSIHHNSANDQWSTDFIVNMRWDDRRFLQHFRCSLGYVGHVRRVVGTKAETLWLCSVFDFFPLWSKKSRDYAIWREAVQARSLGRGAGVATLERCFAEIRSVREYDEEGT